MGRITKRSKKKPFLDLKYRRATARGVVSLRPLFSAVTSPPLLPEKEDLVAVLSWSQMFQRCKASAMQRRTVTVMANHPSIKTHVQDSLIDSVQRKRGSTNSPAAQTRRKTRFHSRTHLVVGSRTEPTPYRLRQNPPLDGSSSDSSSSNCSWSDVSEVVAMDEGRGCGWQWRETYCDLFVLYMRVSVWTQGY